MKPLEIISLGAGVQSTVMTVMAANGLLEPIPDAAIFADTGAEPAPVYRMVEWLRSEMPFPVRTVAAGRALTAAVEHPVRGYVPIPTFQRRADTGHRAMGRRQCTSEYKIRPIDAEIRRMLGLRPRQHWPTEHRVNQWLGISVDELERARPNHRDPVVVNRYPLLDGRWTRHDLLGWWDAHAPAGAPALGRSACVFCPYRSAREWAALTEDELASAAETEDAMNADADEHGHRRQYLHPRMIPVRAAVAADAAAAAAQPSLFDDASDCDSGYCFV